MNRLTPSVCVCMVFAVAMAITGCGGSSGVKLIFPSGAAMAIDQGQSVTVKVSTTGDAGMGVTWTCSGAACTTLASASATSVTFNATGNAGTATITATSIKQNTVTASVTVTVSALPAISTTQVQLVAAPATAGVAYNFSFAATGGAGKLLWSATGLPAGLSISSTTGAISGTAAAKGSPSVTVTVTDSSTAGPKSVSSTLTLTINNPAPPAITTTQAQVTAAPGTTGSIYGFTFHATGNGTLTWSATGLPSDGLSLAAGTGIVSGTPTSKATFSLTVTVSDSFGQSSAPTAFALAVNNPAAPTITTTQAQVTAASGTVGTAYSLTFHDAGTGALTWSAIGLPADGLSFNSSTGVVSGTPTSKQSVAFTLTVSDTFGQSTAATPFALTVNNPAAPVISTTPAQVPSATVNVAYNFTFQGKGFGTLAWSTTPALSDGLSINSSTGKLTGTPTTATTLAFGVSLTDALGQVTTVNGYSIVASTESIAFTPSAPTSATAGGTLTVNAIVSSDPGSGGVNWSVTCASAPCGSFSSSHTASGTATTYNAPTLPPTGGTVTITATAADAPSPLVSAVVTVNAAPLVVSTKSLPGGTVNTSYSGTVTASGGVPPYTFSLDASSTALPANLTFTTGSPSATITGTPTATGTTNNIIVDVKDSEGTPMTAQMTYTLKISNATADCTGAPTGHESTLNGHYVFLFEGWAGSSTGTPQAYVASFAADGAGNIQNLGSGVGGEVDTNDSINGPQNFTINSTISNAASLYKVGTDPTGSGDVGCVVIASSSQGGSATFRFSLGHKNGSSIYTKGRLIEFDDTTGTGSRGSAVMLLQTTPFTITANNYAFGASGWDAARRHVATGGFLTVSSGGAITNLTADTDDAGTVNSGVAGPILGAVGNNGTVGTPDATAGRSILTVNYQVGASVNTFHFARYPVNTDEYFYISTDAVSSSVPLLAGRGIVTHAAGTFSNLSLGGNYVLHATGNGSGVANVALGLFTFSSGSINGTINTYAAGTVPSSATPSGSYSVDTQAGRTTSTAGGKFPPTFYVAAPTLSAEPISIFSVGTDPEATFGVGEASTGTFATAGMAGNYFFGTDSSNDNTVTDEVGVVSIASSGALTGTQDSSGSTGGNVGLQTNPLGAGSLTITNPNGAGNVGTGTIGYANGASFFFFDAGGSNNSPAKITVVEKQ
jgi:large repetitive protein